VLNTLDLAYYPEERGPYNFDPNDDATTPNQRWAGITRQLTSTDLEQSNVEFIEFWLQDPFQEDPTNQGGKLVFNLGNISEDVLKDGRKQYENGLPEDGNISLLQPTDWGTVVPLNQSLIYAFDSEGQERTNQDVGYDGYDDEEERRLSDAFANLEDPANDNYRYFLDAEGDIFERYRRFNGVEGNTPDTFSDTQRASNPQPDAEDINRDNTMNTIDSYFQYEIDITPQDLNVDTNPLIVDFRDNESRTLQNGIVTSNAEGAQVENPKWYLFRIPVESLDREAIGGITDLRSARFIRMYVKDFRSSTVFRFGSLDLVRSDWRRFGQSLKEGAIAPVVVDNDDEMSQNADSNPTEFSLGIIGTIDNSTSYTSPPGIQEEQLFNNNTVIDQNEQSLVLNVCGLDQQDSRAAFKNINLDMRQYERLRMFIHAQDRDENNGFTNASDAPLVGFVRIGNDLNDNYYQIEVPLEKSVSGRMEKCKLYKMNLRVM
jgi:cell surface protein SprA